MNGEAGVKSAVHQDRTIPVANLQLASCMVLYFNLHIRNHIFLLFLLLRPNSPKWKMIPSRMVIINKIMKEKVTIALDQHLWKA